MNGGLSSIPQLTLLGSKDVELWGSLFMHLGPFQQIFYPKEAQVLKVFHTEKLFHMKYFISGNAKAIQVSIFLRNILTFVSKHFF